MRTVQKAGRRRDFLPPPLHLAITGEKNRIGQRARSVLSPLGPNPILAIPFAFRFRMQ